jgi:hypothetical protein
MLLAGTCKLKQEMIFRASGRCRLYWMRMMVQETLGLVTPEPVLGTSEPVAPLLRVH